MICILCFTLVFVFGIDGPRSPAAFKVELFLTKLNGQVTIIIIKNSILYMTGILDLPLKNIDKLKNRDYGLSSVFVFH